MLTFIVRVYKEKISDSSHIMEAESKLYDELEKNSSRLMASSRIISRMMASNRKLGEGKLATTEEIIDTVLNDAHPTVSITLQDYGTNEIGRAHV